MAVGVARTPATCATRVSHGVRTSAIAWRMRVSATSNTVTVPVTRMTIHATRTIALSPSHHLPEALRWRGRGGGSPEGRRRLRTRAMAGGAGRVAGMDRPGPGGACGNDAMPADAPPMIAPRTSPFVLVRRYGDPHLPPGEGTSCDVGLPVFSGCSCSR